MEAGNGWVIQFLAGAPEWSAPTETPRLFGVQPIGRTPGSAAVGVPDCVEHWRLDRPEVTERFAVLDEFAGWIEAHRDSMTARELSLALGTSPLDGRDKRGVWLDVEGAEHVGRLIVWDTGEAELELADVTTDGVSAQHRHIETRADLERALTLLVAWVDPGA